MVSVLSGGWSAGLVSRLRTATSTARLSQSSRHQLSALTSRNHGLSTTAMSFHAPTLTVANGLLREELVMQQQHIRKYAAPTKKQKKRNRKKTEVVDGEHTVVENDGQRYRLVASVIVERLPIVMPEPPEWEVEYQKMMAEHRNKYGKTYPEEWFKSGIDIEALEAQRQRDRDRAKAGRVTTEADSGEAAADGDDNAGDEEEEIVLPDDEPDFLDTFEPAPRVTEADRTNDRKSLNRALDKRLYLIVKRNRDSHSWQFPQTPRWSGESMRTVCKRNLKNACGSDLRVYWSTFAPIGHFQYEHENGATEEWAGSQRMEGDCATISDSSETDIVDHLWVTKDELGEYLSEGYYKSVKDIIFQ